MMHLPPLPTKDNAVAGGQHSALQNLEPMPLHNLEFPSLISSSGLKRVAHQAPTYPAKRRKSLVLTERTVPSSEKEDNSWIDNFSLLDSLYPEDSSPFKPSANFPGSTEPSGQKHQRHEVNVEKLIRKALDVTSEIIHERPEETVSLPMTQVYTNNSGYPADSSQIQPRVSHQESSHQARVISQEEMTEDAIPQVVSPSLNAVESTVPQHQVPAMIMPLPQQPPMIDSSAFTISKLKSSNEPTLLTLTSYPFRVVYANEAFSKLSSGRRASVIGDSVFDTFNIEGRIMRPSLATYPTLTGRLDNQIALVPSFQDEQNNEFSVRCSVQAYPVTKRNDSNALRYFAIRFTPL